MKNWTSLFALLLAFSIVGCTGGGNSTTATNDVSSDDPAEHTKALFEAAKAGKLADAYASALPASYQSDVSGLAKKAASLLTEAEFDRVSGVLRKIGGAIAPLVLEEAATDPSATQAAKMMEDLPKALGFGSYAEFSNLDPVKILAVLGPQIDLSEKLGSIEAKILDQDGDAATIEVTVTDPAGVKKTDKTPMTKVDGKWLPNEMVANWNKSIAEASKALDDAIAQKKANPKMITAQLDMFEPVLEGMLANKDALKGFYEQAKAQAKSFQIPGQK